MTMRRHIHVINDSYISKTITPTTTQLVPSKIKLVSMTVYLLSYPPSLSLSLSHTYTHMNKFTTFPNLIVLLGSIL